MKHNIFNKIIVCSALMATGLTSCDYLNVVPAEQATIEDATRKKELTLGYLYSCYSDLNNWNPVNYMNEDVASTDEYVLPSHWNPTAYQIQNDQRSSDDGGNWFWRHCGYDGIRTCYLFLDAVKTAPGLTDEERRTWSAEAQFLIAYYHFMVLRKYGPCPIIDHAYDVNTMASEVPGRSHFDAVVKFIIDKLDNEAIPDLPNRYTGGNWGRADKVIAKAIKARVLLTAASPQWNGNTMYETGPMKWENGKGGWETPEYGKQLVNPVYSEQKWKDARNACEEALNFARSQGLELYEKSDFEELKEIPENQKEFMKYVLRMRYAVMSRPNSKDNCQEQVWGLADQSSTLFASLPRNIVEKADGTWTTGWGGIAPTLNAVKQFYTKNGKLPEEDSEFYNKSEYYKLAGEEILENEPSFGGWLDADEVIKLNTMREPRFYAWIAFNGGEYGVHLVSEQNPFICYMRYSDYQGYRGEQDYSYTGYLCQKWAHPALSFTANGDNSENNTAPRPLIRMAELYLNLAECEAALEHTDAFLSAINPVRRRAGIPELKSSDITPSKTATDWVRSERFVEFYGEGIRYYDVRRWLEGKKYFGGPYTGLNVGTTKDPSVANFNQETIIVRYENVKWNDRSYLSPLYFNEVDKSDTMIQCPGY